MRGHTAGGAQEGGTIKSQWVSDQSIIFGEVEEVLCSACRLAKMKTDLEEWRPTQGVHDSESLWSSLFMDQGQLKANDA